MNYGRNVAQQGSGNVLVVVQAQVMAKLPREAARVTNHDLDIG